MSSKTRESVDRSRLLENLSRFASGGAAESSELRSDEQLFKDHLPILEHRRVLERETLLVLGGRGTGKSQLFDVLRKIDDPYDLLPRDKDDRQRLSNEHYCAGYTARGRRFPRSEVLEKVLTGSPPPKLNNIWLGLLVGVLLQEEVTSDSIQARLPSSVKQGLQDHLSEPSHWLGQIEQELESVSAALDRADEELANRQKILTATYDDLDILAGRLTDVYPLVRELLAFWLRNSRRWSNLRCKIFLRTDIFEAEDLAFTDSSKLRPLSVTLRWNADNLYRLVLKRLLNGDEGDQWRRFIGKGIPKSRLPLHQRWGVLPQTNENDHRVFVEQLVGKWMGSDKRKGDTYRWFLNHLQDSLGDIAPRSFLKIFEFSANRQLTAARPSTHQLVLPEQIAGALEMVSKDRIEELKEEYGWIDVVGRNLNGQTVPMKRDEVRACITRGKIWDKLPDTLGRRPDRQDRLIDYLISLGIFREATEDRIHVPDIYLFGFGLKRKGGIRRPRV